MSLVARNKYIRRLLLTAMYILGMLGIVASGGGGGASVSITGLNINQPSSPTYESRIRIYGDFDIKYPRDVPFTRTVTITWNNQLTSESGAVQHVIEQTCIWLVPPFDETLICGIHGSDSFEFWVPLESGSNIINVTASMSGSERQASVTVVRLPPLPHVETLPPTEIRPTGGKLNGSVNPNEVSAEIWFEYSTNSDLSSSISTPVQTIDAGAEDVTVSEAVSNLITDSTYYYRIVGTNVNGTVQGSILTLIPVNVPDVTTSPAMQLFPRESTLSGSVNPNGFDTDGWFQLGFDPNFAAYDILSPMLPVGSGNTFVPVDHLFDQLSTGTKYYYRLNASNIWGSVNGGVLNFTTPLAGDNCWVKNYRSYIGSETQGLGEINSIDQTLDGGFILSSDASNGIKPGGPLIVKTNSEGGVEWSNFLHLEGINNPAIFPYYTSGNIVSEISDGKYIVAGTGQTTGGQLTFYQFLIKELKADGSVLWQKSYYAGGLPINAGTIIVSDIKAIPGGLIVTGETGLWSAGERDIWVMRLDQTGNIIWQFTYGGSMSEYAYEIEIGDDGFFLIGGTRSYGAGSSDLWVLKLDFSGNIVWQKTYGPGGSGTNKYSATAAEISNKEITITGTFATSQNIGDQDLWVINLNSSDGSINWQTVYGGLNQDNGFDVDSTIDGGFIVLGRSASFSSGYSVWLVKLDSVGLIEWQKQIQGYGIPYNVREDSNGGYVLTTSGTDFTDFYLIKTDINGTCSSLGTDTASVPVSTNVLASSSSSSRRNAGFIGLAKGSTEVRTYLAIDQYAP